MTERDFIYWLNGFFELTDPKSLNEAQILVIRDHIRLVMDKETPQRDVTVPPFDFPNATRSIDEFFGPKLCSAGESFGGQIDPRIRRIVSC